MEDSTTPAVGASRLSVFLCERLPQLTSLLPGESDGRARMAIPGSGHGLLRNHSWARGAACKDAWRGCRVRQRTLTSSQNSRAASSSAAASLSPTNGSPAAPPPLSILCSVQHDCRLTSVAHRWPCGRRRRLRRVPGAGSPEPAAGGRVRRAAVRAPAPAAITDREVRSEKA